MTDKMTPAHLRDLADAIDAPNAFAPGAEIASKLRQEAARREAEAKPDIIEMPDGCPKKGCGAQYVTHGGCIDRDCPQREGLDGADAELAHSLRSVVTVDHSWPPMALSIIRRYEMDRLAAKDRIEAQAREIVQEVSAKFQWANAYERTLGDYHTVRKERDTLKARVAELEQSLGCQKQIANEHRNRAQELERRLFPYADDTEVSGMGWGGFYLIGNKASISELGRLENRSSQLEVYQRGFDERHKAEKARAEQAEAKAARLVAHISNTLAMFDCAGLPTNPDSLPQMVKHELKAMLAEADHAGK